MSRTRIIVLAAAVFSIGMMGVARAETRPGDITFTPLVGGYVFEGNQNIQNGPLLGAALGMDFSKYIGAEAMFNYINTKNEFSGNDVDGYVYHLDGLFYFWPGKKFAPYFAAGGGGISLNPKGDEGQTNWLVDYGLGLEYFLTRDLAIRGDVRHLITFDDHYNNLSYAVGFTYHWGGAKPAPAEALQKPAEIPEKVVPPQKEVCVYLDVYFDFDRAEIKPRYHDQIKKIADFMKAHPDIKATIKGYADWVGTEEYNKLLSDRRAENVKNYLVNDFGIDAGRISVLGFGENRPRATNETHFGRQLNRRASQISCTFEITFK